MYAVTLPRSQQALSARRMTVSYRLQSQPAAHEDLPVRTAAKLGDSHRSAGGAGGCAVADDIIVFGCLHRPYSAASRWSSRRKRCTARVKDAATAAFLALDGRLFSTTEGLDGI